MMKKDEFTNNILIIDLKQVYAKKKENHYSFINEKICNWYADKITVTAKTPERIKTQIKINF